jgi:hypothetical protein
VKIIMKASEVIEQIQKIVAKEGNLEVHVTDLNLPGSKPCSSVGLIDPPDGPPPLGPKYIWIF